MALEPSTLWTILGMYGLGCGACWILLKVITDPRFQSRYRWAARLASGAATLRNRVTATFTSQADSEDPIEVEAELPSTQPVKTPKTVPPVLKVAKATTDAKPAEPSRAPETSQDKPEIEQPSPEVPGSHSEDRILSD